MLEFLLTNLPIVICVVVGAALIVVEMFVPGFGVPGVSGIVAVLIGAVLLYMKAGPLAALEYLFVAIALIGVALFIAMRSASHGRLSKSPIILKKEEDLEEGQPAESDLTAFIGRKGVAETVLRPSGIGNFDGVRLNVVSNGTYLEKGAAVRVERVEGSRIVVTEQ